VQLIAEATSAAANVESTTMAEFTRTVSTSNPIIACKNCFEHRESNARAALNRMARRATLRDAGVTLTITRGACVESRSRKAPSQQHRSRWNHRHLAV
jgi:hypothetical protein